MPGPTQQPDDSFQHLMALAVERHRQGDPHGADAATAKALSLRPDHPGARQMSGLFAAGIGDFSRAAELLEPFARSPQAPPEILHATATACFALARYDAAAALLARVLAVRAEDRASWVLLAKCDQARGAIDSAVRQLRRALVMVPAAPETLLTYGALVARQNRDEDRRVVDWWRLTAPRDPAAWSVAAGYAASPQIGARYLRRSLVLLATDASVAQAQIHAAALTPGAIDMALLYRWLAVGFAGDADAWHSAARYHDGAGDIDRSAAAARRASLLRPGIPHFDLQVARADRRRDHTPAAKAGFRRLVRIDGGARHAAQAHLQLTRIAEEEGAYAAAFDHAEAGNGLLRRLEPDVEHWIAERKARVAATIDTVPHVRRHLEQGAGPAGEVGTDLAGEQPVFLIGFPRSGTTLLEQVLDGHPDIATIEEQPTLAPVLRWIAGRYGPLEAFVETASAAEAAVAADLYLTARAGFVTTPDVPVVIDKMPLSTVLVPLILRLFPRARFLFALRHPCDVCLSCFFNDFILNANMAPFASFRETAEFYDLVMRLWGVCVAELPVDHHVVRYESVVDDLESEARAAIGFLDLPWHPEIVDFHRTVRAKARQGRIRTPSYAQVAEPLYARSAGRWRNYGDRFETVRRRLQPHVEAFGYRWE